jgi:filamentous hemagglutinin family protein
MIRWEEKMITNRRFKHFITLFLSPFLISGLLLHPAIITFSHAASTITSDGTMGTTINQAGNIYNINGGTIKGTNQFHSFGLFSVGPGDAASFNGASWIANIIGRITGGQQSIIDGTLRSKITGANLYLLNPSGVLFGPNAALSVSGSFHVSTADYLRMADGARFYADLGKESTLSTAPVAAFGFLSSSPAAISIQGSNLSVPEGKTLSIIGGDINITGGQIAAPSGRINIASVASPGEVIPVESRDAPDVQMSSFDRLGGINLQNSTYLDVSSSSGNGTVVIRGGKLLIENSYIVADTTGDKDGAKVGIDIGIKEDLVVNGGGMHTDTYGSGRAGDINIATNTLQISGGGQILANSYADGQGGSIYINAVDQVILSGSQGDSTGIYSLAQGGSGSGGDIQITAGNLQINGGGLIDAETWGQGNGGTTIVTAKNILLDAGNPNTQWLVGMSAQTSGSGKAGDINITANTLEMKGGAQIFTITNADGQGGSIYINADQVNLSTGVFIQALATGVGRSGDIAIHTDSMEVKDSQISSATLGQGDAGSLIVTAKNVLFDIGTFAGFGVGMYSYTFGSGKSGDINITTNTLDMRGGAQMSTSSWAEGQGGSINVNADQVILSGTIEGYPTGLYAGAHGSGSGGGLRVTSGSLLLTDGAILYSGSTGAGNAGNIQVNAGNLQLLNGGVIKAGAESSGNGGDIVINSGSVLVSGATSDPYYGIYPSGIASQTSGSGNGGNVRVKAGSLQLLDGGRITTETFADSNAGTIQITADNVLISGVNALIMGYQTSIGADPKRASSAIRTSSNGSFLGDVGAKGDGGNLLITARNVQVQDGGLITSQTYTSGNGGNIDLTVDRMNLFNGGTVSAESSGPGYAGNIGIKVTNTLLLKDSSITTEAKYTDGGNIQVDAGYKVSLVDSKITASVGGGPDTVGGNITIDPEYVILNDSQIIANAYEGKGGNIRIIADVFLASPDSIVDASSALGINGTVDIRAPITNISGTLAPMQGNFLSTEMLLRDRCIARIRGEKYSSFVVRGRDGLPIRPGSVLPSPIY